MIQERGGYKHGPSYAKLPSLRALTAELKDLHEAWSHPDVGGEYVRLVCVITDYTRNHEREWRILAASQIEEFLPAWNDERQPLIFGWEYIPGDGARFDATGAARRLLSAAREAGYK